MPDGAQNPFVAGTANLREATKWIIGAMVTTVIAVLAGGSLTSLGALHAEPRLYAALAGAGVAYLLAGVILWNALAIVTTETVSFDALIGADGVEAEVRKRIEKRMAPMLPDGCKTFAALAKRSEHYRNDHSKGSAKRYADFVAVVIALEPQLGFEYKRDRFVRLRRLLFSLMPIVIAGVGLFAWAANPKPPVTLSEAMVVDKLTLNEASAAIVAKAEGADCRAAVTPGARIAVLVVREEGDRTQLVTLMPEPKCPPVHLTQQFGRVFVPK